MVSGRPHLRSVVRRAARLAALLVAVSLIDVPGLAGVTNLLTAVCTGGEVDAPEGDVTDAAPKSRPTAATSPAATAPSGHRLDRPSRPSDPVTSPGHRPDPFGNGLGLRLRC